MAIPTEFRRTIIKRSTITGTVPTIPANEPQTVDDFENMLSTDLLIGEYYLNTADDRLWIRTGTGIHEILLGDGLITCADLVNCQPIIDLDNRITDLENNNNFYIGVNFESTDPFIHTIGEKIKITSIDNPDSISYSIKVNGVSYSIGNTINLYDELLITPNSVGYLKINCELV